MTTRVGQKRVLGQLRPHPKGAGPKRAPNFGDLLYAHTVYEKQQPNFAWSPN